MCKSRKGIEDKANVTFLCTLDKSIEFWQILIKEMGSTFVYAALLIFLTLSLEQQGVSKYFTCKKIFKALGN